MMSKIREEIYIDRATPEQCRAVFDTLHARREEFEAAYGQQLQWEPPLHNRPSAAQPRALICRCW
jgi:hypothetical protein